MHCVQRVNGDTVLKCRMQSIQRISHNLCRAGQSVMTTPWMRRKRHSMRSASTGAAEKYHFIVYVVIIIYSTVKKPARSRSRCP